MYIPFVPIPGAIGHDVAFSLIEAPVREEVVLPGGWSRLLRVLCPGRAEGKHGEQKAKSKASELPCSIHRFSPGECC